MKNAPLATKSDKKRGHNLAVPLSDSRISGLRLDHLVVDQLLLHFLAFRVKAEMLAVQLKFHVLHGTSRPVLFYGEHHPVAILAGSVGVKGDVILRQNLIS